MPYSPVHWPKNYLTTLQNKEKIDLKGFRINFFPLNSRSTSKVELPNSKPFRKDN
jgi:hypothetical protein